ncbi:MAG: hypothetical protein MZV70_54365 [Desulfobacterales bacterium]|nr:hypothetical protein [Desulfobacterales bacterium]
MTVGLPAYSAIMAWSKANPGTMVELYPGGPVVKGEPCPRPLVVYRACSCMEGWAAWVAFLARWLQGSLPGPCSLSPLSAAI